MPLPRDTSGKATRSAALSSTGYYGAGDYVVPEFTESGSKVVNGQIVGDGSSVSAMAQRMSEHALMGGALPLVITHAIDKAAKRTKAAKKVKPLPAQKEQKANSPIVRADGYSEVVQPVTMPTPIDVPVSAVASPSIDVVFSTPLGKIKVVVTAVLDSVNSLILVFANEGEIRYEPAPGANVELIINGRAIETMYPGFKFPWIDDRMALMVFVKTAEE